MTSDMPIDRSPGVAPGRSSGSATEALVWAVATSEDKSLDLRGQARRSFAKLDRVLSDLGTDKRYLLSATVFLADLEDKQVFDDAWREWIGLDPAHWPQRACVGVSLSAGTLVEISVVAARREAPALNHR
jgi:enamine deaminase RidA (YjgF/YER057c/UK114 family)